MGCGTSAQNTENVIRPEIQASDGIFFRHFL